MKNVHLKHSEWLTEFYLKKQDQPNKTYKQASYWNDVDFMDESKNQLNMIVEIPKFSTFKYEISLQKEQNPIVQDMKDGRPRHYFGPIYWNYGAIPQTYENPKKQTKFESGNAFQGDGDPLDAIDISDEIMQTGEVIEVKLLGALVMIDNGEVDYKLITAHRGTFMSEFNCVSEIEQSEYKWVLSAVREWFRLYKYSDGVVNKFENGEKYLTAMESRQLLQECHEEWKIYQTTNQNVQKDASKERERRQSIEREFPELRESMENKKQKMDQSVGLLKQGSGDMQRVKQYKLLKDIIDNQKSQKINQNEELLKQEKEGGVKWYKLKEFITDPEGTKLA